MLRGETRFLVEAAFGRGDIAGALAAYASSPGIVITIGERDPSAPIIGRCLGAHLRYMSLVSPDGPYQTWLGLLEQYLHPPLAPNVVRLISSSGSKNAPPLEATGQQGSKGLKSGIHSHRTRPQNRTNRT